VPSTGTHETGANREKQKRATRYQARENMQLVLSAGKHATGFKHEKLATDICTGNTRLVPSAGNIGSVKHGKPF